MSRTSISEKKHLNFKSMHQSLSKHLLDIDDHRVASRCSHTLHDAFMSAFACMYFQDPSLAHFQRSMEEHANKNNLRTLFGVKAIPKDSQLRDIIDNTHSESLRPVFKEYFEHLRRGKHMEEFQVLPGLYLCAIDGVQYHSSENVSCDQCLTKKHSDGSVTHHHSMLQGAFMHPDKRQVIPVMPEPIANSDGSVKQDCEMNAAKRFIKKLKADHPRLGIVIVGDGLFSKGPMIRETILEGMHYLFVAKPGDHTFMMKWLEDVGKLPEVTTSDIKGRKHTYTYQNQVPLNGQDDAPLVNYIHYELTNKKGKVTYRCSWVTDIKVDDSNVERLAKGGRCRWKIENECFNTLKNQGYHLEHNFGHGKKHLSHNIYLLTMIAFLFHQVFELTDPAYQHCRQSLGSKRQLWQRLKVLMEYFIFESWNDLLIKLMSGRGGIPSLSKENG